MTTINEIVAQAKASGGDLAEYIISWQAAALGCADHALREKLRLSLQVMREAVAEGLATDKPSPSGLSGGDARRFSRKGPVVLGSLAHKAVAYALATGEMNASMGRVVAAPTAGASGVLPGVLLAASEEFGLNEEQLINGLAVAGGIGLVIAEQSTLAGAEGGCQAECGSAAAMAAGALVYLCGGSVDMVAHAVAHALKNQIGLVCDPVAGLVEVPCVKRNGGSAVIALMACEMALAGVQSFIPADEVIEAVAEVGRLLPTQLKETGQGGLANTKTARQFEKESFKR
jgi:L-serine dehydratase